jgi:amino acid adenylation domain-containing protein
MSINIYNLFFTSFKRAPNTVCISFPARDYTYKEIFVEASKLSQFIKNDQCTYIGILAHRSLSAYVGILASLQVGKTYVPLNPKFPSDKLNKILLATKMQTIVVDNESLAKIKELLPQKHLTFLAPELNSTIKIPEYPNITIFDLNKINGSEMCHEILDTPQAKAYLLFTSGSTGEPKGIEIAHQNVLDYLDHTQERLQLNCNDKCSQIFDLSFDLSVHDLFLTWMNGATLCIPEKSIFNPVKFVIANNLTIWFSVPSVGYYLLNNNFLKPALFPSLRLSLFCGEPLIASLVEQWQIAAPDSEIENLYGPTESTIAISSYLWERNKENKVRNGIVSIGKIFPTQKYLIVDEKDCPLGKNSMGELLLSGSQVISRYYTSSYNLSDKFVKISETTPALYYRTGDIVYEDNDGDNYFLQRKDFEFKIRGYRVEEEEINNVLRKITNISNVISLPYNGKIGAPEGVASFIESNDPLDEFAIISECKKLLPDYMIPNKIYVITEFPINSNGKTDRAFFINLLNNKD